MTDSFKCGMCGETYLGQTMQWGRCSVCNEPLCAICWRREYRTCAAHRAPHAPPVAPSPTSSYPQCSRCGREMILKKDFGGACERCALPLCNACFDDQPFCAAHLPLRCAFGHPFHADLAPVLACQACGALVCSNHAAPYGVFCPQHLPPRCAACSTISLPLESPAGQCPRCPSGEGVICAACVSAGNTRCPTHRLIKCTGCGNDVEPETVNVCSAPGCDRLLCESCSAGNNCPEHRLIACGHCGMSFPLSTYHVHCSTAGCLEPICQSCLAFLGTPACRSHAASVNPATRRLWMRAVERILFERFKHKLATRKTVVHPWTNRRLALKTATWRETSEAAPPAPSAVLGELPQNRMLTCRLPVSKTSWLELELRFASRINRLCSPGCDREPLPMSLLLHLIETWQYTGDRPAFGKVVCLVSPTGFTEDCRELVCGSPQMPAFHAEQLVIILLELPGQTLYYDVNDQRGQRAAALFRPETETEQLIRLRQSVGDRLMTRYAVSASEIAGFMTVPELTVRAAFERFCRDGFRIETVDGDVFITDKPLPARS